MFAESQEPFLFRVHCAVAIRQSISEPVRGDKPPLQRGGFPPITKIAEILYHMQVKWFFNCICSLYRFMSLERLQEFIISGEFV